MLSLRRVLATAILTATACLSLAGCSQKTFYRPLPDLQKVGLRELWSHRLPLFPGEKVLKAWRVGDSIYITTSESKVIRLTMAGEQAWAIDLGEKQYQIFRPSDTIGGKNVLVVNRGKGYLVDKQTGNIVLQNALAVAVMCDPVVAGNTFCVGGVNSYRSLYLDTLGGKKWNTPAKDDVFSVRPSIEGDTILLASENGKLWRINALTGDWLWRDRKVNGRVVGGLASDSRAVYVPCLDNNLYAFEMSSGAFLWSKPLEGRLDRPLSVTRSDVLVPSSGKGLYAINNSKGDVHWFADSVAEVGTIVRDRVWVSDAGGNVLALSLDTGEVLSSTATGGRVITNNVDQNVLLINDEGSVAAYTAMK